MADQEAANRQLVQQMAMQGAAAKQAPSIATAPEAMQTAMQRSAGVNAPALFNNTQTATIQNPFTRGDAQLAANNAGAGGVLGSISSSTRDYLQQANAGVDLQKEISRRAVQQSIAENSLKAQQMEVQKLRAQADLAAVKAEADPNSIEAQVKKLTLEKQLKELQTPEKQSAPSSPEEVRNRTNIPVAQVKQYEAIPWYQATAPSLFADAQKAGVNSDQFAAGVNLEVQKAIDSGQVDPADGNNVAALIYAQYAPLLPGFQDVQSYAPMNTGALPPVQQAMAQATAPAAPILPPQQQAHIDEVAHQLAAQKAGVITPATVSMSETDAKKLAKAAAKVPKSKRK